VGEQHLELGVPAELDVQSFGEPGNRTFRVYVQTGRGTVSLWLEKEQVVLLGSAIESLLERTRDTVGGSTQSDALAAFSGDLEVKVGALAVGFDPGRGVFTMEVSDFVTALALDGITVLATRAQFERISGQIAEIVAGGRPRCPLCGRPITDGRHFCPESNGHAKVTISE
jgi:uncharacterized repeat protein (TIGR03847 family)